MNLDSSLLFAAYAIAAIVPLLCLWVIYSQNLYSTSAAGVVALCFLWGLTSYYIALNVNTIILKSAGWDTLVLVRYVAPVVEELLKAALLMYLVRRPNFNYFIDGAIYGFAVGIGFAVIENYAYIGRSQDPITLAIARTLSTNLMHATSSALVGVTLGLSRFEKGLFRKTVYVTAGLVFAMLNHGGFNNMITRVNVTAGWLYLYAILAGIGGAAVIFWLINIGLKQMRGWIDEMLGMADQVTKGESRVVLQLAEAGVLLTPIVERFGKQKATQIGRLLAIQAQLGILRKTSQTLPDEQTRLDAKKQISDLQKEMSVLRREIGVYPMLYLRSIFPEDNHSVWTRLESATAREEVIEETSSADFSISDILETLPSDQRRVMQAVIRRMRRASFEELTADLVSASQPMTEGEIQTALNELTADGKLMLLKGETVRYEVQYKHKAGLSLGNNIWKRLSVLSAEPAGGGDIDIWNGLKNLLVEQSVVEKSTGEKSLWLALADRIPQ